MESWGTSFTDHCGICGKPQTGDPESKMKHRCDRRIITSLENKYEELEESAENDVDLDWPDDVTGVIEGLSERDEPLPDDGDAEVDTFEEDD